MNIFKESQNFIGQLNENSDIITLKEVLNTAKEIKVNLGKKGYLLDTYLALFFEAINNTLAFESSESGFQSGCSLQKFSQSIHAKKEDCIGHPIYEKAIEILQANKSIVEFQEYSTQLNILYLTLVDDFFPQMIHEFMEEQKIELRNVLDQIRFQELYQDISHLIGETQMERLNLLLKNKFVVSSALESFVQGFTNDLLYRLITKDIETNKLGFQLLMDTLSSTE